MTISHHDIPDQITTNWTIPDQITINQITINQITTNQKMRYS